MSEETTQEKFYTCKNDLCPCMELAIIKDKKMKAKEVSSGKKLGLVYYFTEAEVEESNWDQAGYEDCEHVEIAPDKGIKIPKWLLILLAALVVLGGGGYGISQLFGGDDKPERPEVTKPEGVTSDQLQQATYLIESVLNQAFPAPQAK